MYIVHCIPVQYLPNTLCTLYTYTFNTMFWYTVKLVYYVPDILCTWYTMYLVHYAPGTPCTQYTVYPVHHVPSTACTQYRMYLVQHVPSTRCTQCTRYLVHYLPNTLGTQYTCTQYTIIVPNMQCTVHIIYQVHSKYVPSNLVLPYLLLPSNNSWHIRYLMYQYKLAHGVYLNRGIDIVSKSERDSNKIYAQII